MAGPIRLRHSEQSWSFGRVERDLRSPLDRRFGATLSTPWFKPPGGYEARRLEMDNGDLALFCWDGNDAYWLGNTETPEALWRTEKVTFEAAPADVSEWAERELVATLHEEESWLADYEHLSWFFLPVLCSKDGRETTREFFREHAAGFPDADRAAALGFYDAFLSTGILNEYRYTMAAKLGTSERNDTVRMAATMAEFNAAKLLTDVGHEFIPEVELDSGHALDFRVADTLVEVTRPSPPSQRRAGTPASAVRETVDGKTRDQLEAHEGAVLLVDCSSFLDDEWTSLLAEQPDVGYAPAALYRMRPDGRVEGYTTGRMPLAVADAFDDRED